MGSRLNNYSPSTEDLTSLMNTLNATFSGFNSAVLTGVGSSIAPTIASGSIADSAGNLYMFSTEELISTTSVASTVNGIWGIVVVPASTVCTVQYSTNTPTFISSFNGFYSSAGSSNRVIGMVDFINSGYYNKNIMADHKLYGLLSSGVPLAMKQLSISFSSGSSATTSTHYIALAFTNHRIVDARSIYNDSYDIVGESSVLYGILQMSWDDSTFQAINGSTSNGVMNYRVLLTYKMI